MGFTIDGGGTVSDYGIFFNSRNNVTIRNGTIKGFGYAGIYQGSTAARYATVMYVQVLDNGTLGSSVTHSGIYLISTNSRVERCTAGNNGGFGIDAYTSSLLIDNIAFNNGSYGIIGGMGATLSGNTAYNNSNWGIYGVGSNLVKDNTIYLNNTSNTAGQGGLYVNADSRVSGNALDGNSQNNIYVYGSDNTIESNLVTDSINGIFFNASGNFYGNNRASSNTTNFNLNGTTQTTNTYLPNIGF